MDAFLSFAVLETLKDKIILDDERFHLLFVSSDSVSAVSLLIICMEKFFSYGWLKKSAVLM